MNQPIRNYCGNADKQIKDIEFIIIIIIIK